MGAHKAGRILVGFALETDHEEANAEGKLQRKNFDFIVLNSLRDAGAGFGVDTNKVTLIDRAGREEPSSALESRNGREDRRQNRIHSEIAMLRRLKVENYALIDRLELEPDDRLNIITGETGAGKSILLGALGLLLGNKNDNATLKDDKRNCLIEGVFDLGTRDLQAFFDRNDLDYSRETTLTRQITPAGKSRSFINDTPVPLALLRELGSQLIDIHSQHQNLILGSEAFRTQAVDTVAENHDLRMQYTTLYERLCHLRRELARLREEAEAGRKDEEWLRYQVEELAAAHLKEGEQTELEQEAETLNHAEEIKAGLYKVDQIMASEDASLLSATKECMQTLHNIASVHTCPGMDRAFRQLLHRTERSVA